MLLLTIIIILLLFVIINISITALNITLYIEFLKDKSAGEGKEVIK